MNNDPNEFWNRLAQSQLVDGDALETLQSRALSELDSSKGLEPNAESIAQHLVQNKVITKYQAQILLAGRSGPFRFGNYLIVDRFQDGPRQGSFSAKHVPTGHPVVLQFVEGNDDQALGTWRQQKRKAEAWTAISGRNLIRLYEILAVPDYRAWVIQDIVGAPLSSKLPRKGRLPWKEACGIAAQVASGLAKLHAAGIQHGAISPSRIWIASKGPAKIHPSLALSPTLEPPDDPKSESQIDYLAPELDADAIPTEASDMYAVGCLLHRLIRGLPPFAEVDFFGKQKAHQSKTAPSLDKYELPAQLTAVIDSMLNKSPDARPDAISTAKQLAKFSTKPEHTLRIAAPEISSEAAFQKAMTSKPWVGDPKPPRESVTPNIVLPDAPPPRPPIDTVIAPTPTTTPIKRRKRKLSTLIVMACSMVTLAAVIGLGAWIASNSVPASPDVADKNETDTDNTTDVDPENEADQTPVEQGRLVQVLFEDDGKRLWETPTSGQPIDFSYLPTGAQIALAIRPSQLVAKPEGERMLKGLGPDFQQTVQWLNNATGFELNEIDRLLIGFCSTNQVTFSPCYVIHLNSPIPRDQLVALWRPQVSERDEETGVYENAAGFGYFAIADPDDPAMSVGFAMGPAEQMKIVSELAGANPLSSSMGEMSMRSDNQRDFNCLFIPNSLFNDEGQALLTGPLKPVRQYLRDHLPEDIRSGMISMHLDEGFYLEMYASHLPKIKPREMAEQLDGLIQKVRDDVASSLVSSASNPYWDPLRSRFGIMVNEVYRNTRVGIEGKDVLANCWLPEIAGHNLVVGSELALSFSGGAGESAPVVARKAPASLDELLNTPRDLSITTNPDLGLLLAGIKSSIQDDYGNLPFAFDIRLMGNDLLKDGITQNQRPGDFELKQKTLSEILTEIMFQANPDKGATGPNDLACKLIWVVAEEPAGSGQPIILITTRDAAADKGYKLPAAFVVPD